MYSPFTPPPGMNRRRQQSTIQSTTAVRTNIALVVVGIITSLLVRDVAIRLGGGGDAGTQPPRNTIIARWNEMAHDGVRASDLESYYRRRHARLAAAENDADFAKEVGDPDVLRACCRELDHCFVGIRIAYPDQWLDQRTTQWLLTTCDEVNLVH